MSTHVSISYQPGSMGDLKERLLQSMRGGTKTDACQSAHRRGYSHGFIEMAWNDLQNEGLVSQPGYGKPWDLTEKGRSVLAAMEGR